MKNDGGYGGRRLATTKLDGQRLTGTATTHLFEKDIAAGVGAAVDCKNRVAFAETGGDAFGGRIGHKRAKVTVEEGPSGADMTVRQILVVISGAQIYMREGKDRHKREESVLQASWLLRHDRLETIVAAGGGLQPRKLTSQLLFPSPHLLIAELSQNSLPYRVHTGGLDPRNYNRSSKVAFRVPVVR